MMDMDSYYSSPSSSGLNMDFDSMLGDQQVTSDVSPDKEIEAHFHRSRSHNIHQGHGFRCGPKNTNMREGNPPRCLASINQTIEQTTPDIDSYPITQGRKTKEKSLKCQLPSETTQNDEVAIIESLLFDFDVNPTESKTVPDLLSFLATDEGTSDISSKNERYATATTSWSVEYEPVSPVTQTNMDETVVPTTVHAEAMFVPFTVLYPPTSLPHDSVSQSGPSYTEEPNYLTLDVTSSQKSRGVNIVYPRAKTPKTQSVSLRGLKKSSVSNDIQVPPLKRMKKIDCNIPVSMVCENRKSEFSSMAKLISYSQPLKKQTLTDEEYFVNEPMNISGNSINNEKSRKKRMPKKENTTDAVNHQEKNNKNNIASKKSREKSKAVLKNQEDWVKKLDRENKRLKEKASLLKSKLDYYNKILFSTFGWACQKFGFKFFADALRSEKLAKNMVNSLHITNTVDCKEEPDSPF